MQIMYEAGCSAELYKAQGKEHDFPDYTNCLCPQCKKDYLRKHGFYSRYLIDIGFEGEIIIRRYYCRMCRKTVSLLPSFCHPKRTYSLLVIFKFLAEFYIKLNSVCKAVKRFFIVIGIACSRQLLRQYRLRIEENLNSLSMAITEIYALEEPLVTEKTDINKKVRQVLSFIKKPLDTSLKIFKRTGTTYLTKQSS